MWSNYPLCKHCKFGKNFFHKTGDIEFYLGVVTFLWRALPVESFAKRGNRLARGKVYARCKQPPQLGQLAAASNGKITAVN